MAKNDTKIPVDMLIAATNADYTPVIEINWRGIPIQITKHLSLEGMLSFVENVVSNCFAYDTGAYIPEARDFITRCAILESYTNLTLPDDINEKYDVVYSSNIVSFVLQQIDQGEFNSICTAIEKKIDNLAQSNIEALTKQMNEVVAGFNTLEQNLSNIFNGIDNETIAKVAGAIVKGGFDEDKLVKAFMAERKADSKVIQMPQPER